MRWVRTVGRRAALLFFGLFAGLLATEAGLRVAAAVRVAFERPAPPPEAGGTRRILCVGDSNTFGIYLNRDQAYPSQLERRLGGDTRVINLGHPGVNSSGLEVQLPRMLAATQADIVLVQVGVDDFWTLPVAVDSAAQGPSVSSWLWDHLRVFRLLYMVWRSGTLLLLWPSSDVHPLQRGIGGAARYGAETFDFWLETSGQPQWGRAFPDHVRAMRAAADAHGARLVLLTYASDGRPGYHGANTIIRKTAADLAVPLIDVSAAFKSLCQSASCDDLFFGDAHPTEAGYAQEASIVAAWLAEHPAVPTVP